VHAKSTTKLNLVINPYIYFISNCIIGLLEQALNPQKQKKTDKERSNLRRQLKEAYGIHNIDGFGKLIVDKFSNFKTGTSKSSKRSKKSKRAKGLDRSQCLPNNFFTEEFMKTNKFAIENFPEVKGKLN
jgi:hypothetical protein